jgi:hypothetical protein
MTVEDFMRLKTSKPFEVRSGSVVVKIYTSVNRSTGQLYTVSHYYLGKRTRKNFADLNKAKAHAQIVATKLSNGELQVLSLRDDDKARYVAALNTLTPTGNALESVCRIRACCPTTQRNGFDF